jgi:undecaprenyl diphosphate synthase
MHIAIIMDGNGRWAAERDLPRSAGHRAGAKAVEAIVETAARQGIRTLTLYAFSAANWDRPRAEVSALFVLLRRYLLAETPRCLERGIRLNVIGRRDRLDTRLREVVEHSERATAHGAGMHLRIAVDYSSQASLLEVGRRLRAVPVADRSRFLEELAVVDHSSPAAPEVDLLIRTGGEKRLSDFLLWEAAYAELHFVDCLWPDFDAREFSLALEEFARRDRRFGRIVENPLQVARQGNG